jgi:hypothetical protein
VWRGHDEMLDREVAIKEVRLPADLDDEERAELSGLAIQEARATARLSHPGIITIFDVIDNDGAPVIVMELIDGRSLAEILRGGAAALPARRGDRLGTAGRATGGSRGGCAQLKGPLRSWNGPFSWPWEPRWELAAGQRDRPPPGSPARGIQRCP